MNRAGVRLRYWADGPAGRSEVHVLGAWEEGELLVEPVERSVVLADTQQQARARPPCHSAGTLGTSTVCM